MNRRSSTRHRRRFLRHGIALVATLPLLAACAQTPAQAPAASAPSLPPLLPLRDAYDPGNPFARIIRGELPVAKVYEDGQVLVFMSHEPVLPGHALVISRTSQARNLLDMGQDELGRLMVVARRVGQAQVAALGAAGFTVTVNNGAGQAVPHLHIHVIPRMSWTDMHDVDVMKLKRAGLADLQRMAARLAEAMPSGQ